MNEPMTLLHRFTQAAHSSAGERLLRFLFSPPISQKTHFMLAEGFTRGTFQTTFSELLSAAGPITNVIEPEK